MSTEPLFHRLRQELHPRPQAQDRIRRDLLQRINQQTAPTNLLEHIRTLLQASDEQRVRLRSMIMGRLLPEPSRFSYRLPKWLAAGALVLIGLRASPLLFLAPQTIAHSSVIIAPTQGTVLLSLHGLWQPITEEVEVQEGVNIRTMNGEVTLLLHDDGTIRLGPHTTVTLHDVSDRPEPGTGGPTLTLTSGTIWLQGLLPDQLRGIEVVTPGGSVLVHRGSISLEAKVEDITKVRVWDRTADIVQNGQTSTVLSGETTTLTSANTTAVARPIDPAGYTEPWVMQNLSRDAVHQREVAQMQQERRAAQAGILPNSPLYPVKRVAEKMDVLFALSAQSRAQKQLEHASTRLNEAAALIAEDANATQPLTDYRRLLLEIATGSGQDANRALLSQELISTTAELAAAMPADQLYLLKRTVLEASAELSPETIDTQDVEGMLLLDSLNGLQLAIQEYDTDTLQRTFDALRPSLHLLHLTEEEGGLKENDRKEIIALLTGTAEALQKSNEETDGSDALLSQLTNELSPFLPPTPISTPPTPLTPEQIDSLLAGILTRIEIYDLPRSRYNQLQYELAQLKDHPEEGTILRRLLRGLEPELAQYVKPALEELREKMQPNQ